MNGMDDIEDDDYGGLDIDDTAWEELEQHAIATQYQNASQDTVQEDTPVPNLPLRVSQSHEQLRPTEREQWRLQRYGQPREQPAESVSEAGRHLQSEGLDGRQLDHREVALKTQIAGLIHERDRLAEELATTKTSALTSRGEISILRANKTQDAERYAAELSALRKSMQEDATKSRLEVETSRRENENTANDNRFLRHELKEERERLKLLRLREKDRPVPSSPHKLPGRDGFDEDHMVSPSKRLPKPATPTKKKKYKPIPSPGRALDLTEITVPKQRDGPHFIKQLFAQDGGFLEVFSQYAFPSERPFSSVALDAMAKLPDNAAPADFVTIILRLWARALKEKYYKPVNSLVAVVQSIASWESSAFRDEGLLKLLLPNLQTMIDVNAVVRFENSPVSHQNFGQFKQTPKSELNELVDGTKALSLLCRVAELSPPKTFWETIDSNFLLMMLNVAQPIAELGLTLGLLATSILTDTFGSIQNDQTLNETFLVNRIGYLLWELPRVDEGEPPLSRLAIYQLRSEALSVLTQLANRPRPANHSILLINEPTFISRLVRFVYDTVDELYSPVAPTTNPTLHKLLSSLINRATRLLFYLLQLHGSAINLHDKLAAVNGGIQKHRVALTRLALSERQFLESGVTEETVEMAQAMLEEAITPEEADALVQVFPAPETETEMQMATEMEMDA